MTISDKKLDLAKQHTLLSHLKSEDFFNVEAYPSSIFEVIDVKSSKGVTTHVVEGDLTIKGVTHKMEIPANIVISNNKIDVRTKFRIIRTKFNINHMIEESFEDQKVLPEFEVEVHLVALKD